MWYVWYMIYDMYDIYIYIIYMCVNDSLNIQFVKELDKVSLVSQPDLGLLRA